MQPTAKMNADTFARATEGMGQGYNENSFAQKSAVQSSTSYMHQAANALNIDTSALVIIADYGSSHGVNSVHAMDLIIQALKETKKIADSEQRILIVHNDLPTNDWPSLFETLDKNNSYYGVASGRSFYEQCLPPNSLAIGYSSMSMHWLSRKPCNLSDQCLVDCTRDDSETNAFKRQAALDYTRFLEHRSRELLPGGVLILGLLADSSDENNREHSDILYRCAQAFLSSEELLDYTLPIYCRSYIECVDQELFAKHNFELIVADFVRIESPVGRRLENGEITLDDFARTETLAVRSALEYPIKQALLINRQRSMEEIEKILNQYWNMHETEVKKQPQMFTSDLKVINLVLRKLKK